MNLKIENAKKPYLEIVIGPEKDGHECQPDDASGVHSETDMLGFIEILGYFPRLESVDGAEANEQKDISERKERGCSRGFAR